MATTLKTPVSLQCLQAKQCDSERKHGLVVKAHEIQFFSQLCQSPSSFRQVTFCLDFSEKLRMLPYLTRVV